MPCLTFYHVIWGNHSQQHHALEGLLLICVCLLPNKAGRRIERFDQPASARRLFGVRQSFAHLFLICRLGLLFSHSDFQNRLSLWLYVLQNYYSNVFAFHDCLCLSLVLGLRAVGCLLQPILGLGLILSLDRLPLSFSSNSSWIHMLHNYVWLFYCINVTQ